VPLAIRGSPNRAARPWHTRLIWRRSAFAGISVSHGASAAPGLAPARARASGVRSMLAFAATSPASVSLPTARERLDKLLIGRVWGAHQLGLYSKGLPAAPSARSYLCANRCCRRPHPEQASRLAERYRQAYPVSSRSSR